MMATDYALLSLPCVWMDEEGETEWTDEKKLGSYLLYPEGSARSRTNKLSGAGRIINPPPNLERTDSENCNSSMTTL